MTRDALTPIFLIRRKTIDAVAWEDESQNGQFLTFWNAASFQFLFLDDSLSESRRCAGSLIRIRFHVDQCHWLILESIAELFNLGSISYACILMAMFNSCTLPTQAIDNA
jgi:hypothetical protein